MIISGAKILKSVQLEGSIFKISTSGSVMWLVCLRIWQLQHQLLFISYLCNRMDFQLLHWLRLDHVSFQDCVQSRVQWSKIKKEAVIFIWKEYFSNLLETILLHQIFVSWVRDLKFWLLAYFLILLNCAKFQQDWTTLILDIL